MDAKDKLNTSDQDTLDSLYLKYWIPHYNYLDYVETPGSLNVGREGKSLIRNISAFPVWFNTLLLGIGNDSRKKYKLGKGEYKTGGVLGNKYYLKSGTCPNDKYRWMEIDNIPNGIGMNVPLRGIIPGIIEALIDINPVNLYMAMSGKSNKLGECFTLKPNNNNNKDYIIIITLIICFFFIIYN